MCWRRKRRALTWHAYASKCARIVEAAAIVLARMAFALVDIRFAPRPRESLRTVARKRTGRVDALAVVLARRALHTLVNVFRAIDAFVAGRTGARVRSIHRTRVADGVCVAWIRCARIVQVAQQSRFARNAATNETANAVDACRPVEAGRIRAIVDVDAAIGSRPAIHANARISADCVRASRTVLAQRRTRQTFVDVVLAVFTREIRTAFAAVRIYAVNAFGSILT